MNQSLSSFDEGEYTTEQIQLEQKSLKVKKTIKQPNKRRTQQKNDIASIYLGKRTQAVEDRQKIKLAKDRYLNRQQTQGTSLSSAKNFASDTQVSELIKVASRNIINGKVKGEISNLINGFNTLDSSIEGQDVRVKVLSQRNQKERKTRLADLSRAKQLLSGKTSSVWIYAIKNEIDALDRDRIYQAYQGLLQDDQTIVPFVREAWEIAPFLQIPNTYFKIVACMHNIKQAFKYKINAKVVQYYIYNNTNDLASALQFKTETKKVKGIFTDISKIITRTEDEIQDNVTIFRENNGLQKVEKAKKFPTFLQLSGKDKTEATLYRANLYGALTANEQELLTHLQNFLYLVRQKYGQVQKEKKHILEYGFLKHGWREASVKEAEAVLRFYARECFYYQVLNSMLRTLKTTQEFRPCVLPFHQTYNAVRYFYDNWVKENARKLPAMTVYRGCKLKKSDFLSLSAGIFIEMYGFMSTSKSRERAQSFMDNEGYLMCIHVKERTLDPRYVPYDHGYVDMNRYGLSQFAHQEQVLFNALNVFKVIKIVNEGRLRMIHLEYGAIFELLNKRIAKEVLTPDEQDTLINYQYCTRLLQTIEDQGDVFLLASEFEEAKDYYKQKIEQDDANAINYYKLANVQKECGEIDLAEQNGKRSLRIFKEKADLNDKETCLKVFSVHVRNADISIQKEDYINAEKDLTEAIEMLEEQNLFEKAKKIRERGDVRFKKGEIRDAERDFEMSEKIFNELKDEGERRKNKAGSNYYIRLITRCCRKISKQQVEEDYDKEIKAVEQMERNIIAIKNEIMSELVVVNNSLQEVAVYAEDKSKYEYCVKKARGYLLSLQGAQSKDPREKAKLKAMEATVQEYLSLAESELLLYQAISLIEKDSPFDLAIAEYSTILAKLQRKALDNNFQLSKDQKNMYSSAEHKQIYDRCKNNLQKAINVLLYNNKTKDSVEVLQLKNQIGDLQYSESNFKNCEEIIAEVKRSKSENTQVCKASVLLAKIAFSRGQLKGAFLCLEEADDSLMNVLLKVDTPQYRKVYERSDCYLEIVLLRGRVYSKQLQSDLALRQLAKVERLINVKIDGFESHALSQTLEQEYGEVHANNGSKAFIDHFTRAIAIRERQMGKYNTGNAISHCNIAKHYLLFRDISSAQMHLDQAAEIFSCLSENHPIQWILYFTNAIFSESNARYEEANNLLQSSISLIENRFDESHITIKKVKLKFAMNLLTMGKIQESLTQLQSLDIKLNQDIRQSLQRVDVQNEIDDEKITLKKIIYTRLKKEQYAFNKSYQQKYDELRATFHLDSQK